MVMERPVVIRAQHLVEVDVDEPISRDHPPSTHVGVLLATNDEVRRTAINNARMQNPQNALDHPLSSLSIQRSEEHTSELQSLMRISYAVLCLIKKHNTPITHNSIISNHASMLQSKK